MIRVVAVALTFAFASPALGRSVALEDMARIVSPYTECEVAGKADMKSLYDEWLPAVQFAAKNPDDLAAKARAEKFSKELGQRRDQIMLRCDYEGVHAGLQARIIKLHPKVAQSTAYWMARNVFSQLNNLNQELLKYEQGVFPAPPAPPK